MNEFLKPDPPDAPEEGEGGGDVPYHERPIEERVLEDLWPEISKGLSDEDVFKPVKPE